MPDFWEKVLGAPQPAQPTPAPAPANVPWWQQTVAPAPVQAAPPAVPQPVATEQPQVPDDGAQSLARTQWSKHETGNCPGCMSANYHAHPEAPNARPRCYDCGYPITQSGSGVSVQGDVGAVQAARQTAASKTNSFNPQNIFHHMG